MRFSISGGFFLANGLCSSVGSLDDGCYADDSIEKQDSGERPRSPGLDGRKCLGTRVFFYVYTTVMK